MAGILANSNSETMIPGDELPDNIVTDYLTTEDITLSTTPAPAGATYEWTLGKPAGANARSDLSSATSATSIFRPDARGIYQVNVTVNATTTYVLRVTVLDPTVQNTTQVTRYSGVSSAAVPTPLAGGFHVFNDQTTDQLSYKKDDGTVVIIGAGAGGGGIGGLLTNSDKGLVCEVTTADGQVASLSPLTLPPLLGSNIWAVVDTHSHLVGNGNKDEAVFFSDDGGTTAKSFGNLATGDLPYWNATKAGHQLAANNRISYNYMSEPGADTSLGQTLTQIMDAPNPATRVSFIDRFVNVGTTQNVVVPAKTFGTIHIRSFQSGIGDHNESFSVMNVNAGGTVTVSSIDGSNQQTGGTVFTATGSGNNVAITPLAGNTNIAIHLDYVNSSV